MVNALEVLAVAEMKKKHATLGAFIGRGSTSEVAGPLFLHSQMLWPQYLAQNTQYTIVRRLRPKRHSTLRHKLSRNNRVYRMEYK